MVSQSVISLYVYQSHSLWSGVARRPDYATKIYSCFSIQCQIIVPSTNNNVYTHHDIVGLLLRFLISSLTAKGGMYRILKHSLVSFSLARAEKLGVLECFSLYILLILFRETIEYYPAIIPTHRIIQDMVCGQTIFSYLIYLL